jgi:hypothetical protein
MSAPRISKETPENGSTAARPIASVINDPTSKMTDASKLCGILSDDWTVAFRPSSVPL